MRPLDLAVAPLILLIALAAAAVFFAAPRIQEDIAARANAALADAGYITIQANADGRTVTLTGALPEGQAVDAPLALIGALPGVASVVDALGRPGAPSLQSRIEAVAAALKGAGAPASGYVFSAVWDGRVLKLSGYMPTRDAREETITHARDVLTDVEIDDAVKVAPGAPDANWQAIVAVSIAAMRPLASAELQLAGVRLTFKGVARSADDYAFAMKILGSLPDPYVASAEIRVDTAAPAPPPPAYRFSAAYDGIGISLAGNVPSPQAAGEIGAVLKETLPEADIDDRSTAAPGAPDGAFTDVLILALGSLRDARTATFAADGRALHLEALVATPTARDALIAAWETLPAAYSATLAILAEGEAAPTEARLGGGAAAACQTAFDTALAASPIVFASSSSELPDSATALLDELVRVAATCPRAKLEIAGHTDASGNQAGNLRLSEDRAEAIEAALILKGIEADRVAARGYGAARPIAANDTDDGKARNRRIEVIVRP